MARFFFRLDDIAPNMNWENFNFIVSVLERHNIKPLLAVIPDNKDPELLKYPANSDFWRIIEKLHQDGWIIAQHGFEHLYKTENGGILKINKRGEFSGLDFKTQKSMIADGIRIMKDRLSSVLEVFVAPGHSFDKNTVKALKENNFRYLSDGIAPYPFEKWGIVWLPQIMWRPRIIPFGLVTVALHPNTMSQYDLANLQKFIEKNRGEISDFSKLMDWYAQAGLLKKVFTFFVNQIFKLFWYLIFRMKHDLSK
ncbi:MAG: DUF2334 domain-containing protein [Candidatus Azambacteria bacterium]|nr:DUF2334 domain-containing protein [Candidatus Azambacteria bacterium]